MASSKQKNVKYKCPFCDKRFTKSDLVIHIGENHDDMLGDDFTPLRYVFNYVNKKSPSYHGRCVICKKDTPWDENKARYDRLCGNPKCKEEYLKRFEENMLRVKGTTRISKTAEGQAQMLANRKISGSYKFQNGVEKTYTGSYELNALKFMDQVMNINPDDIMCPGPILEYTFEGKKHMYITDFYYAPYNLIIEVKDGGKNPNKRDMPVYRGKQIAKEEYIINETDFNYLRLTDNDMSQLLSVFMDLKMQLVDETMDRVIHVNEAALLESNSLNSKGVYHISESGNIHTMQPTIPDNFMTKNGYEDGKTARVCFAPTINQCLMGLSKNCTGLEFYVYTPDGKYNIHKATVQEVPDAEITGELWITETVKVKCIGKIKVIGDKGLDGHPYTYGDKTAELYDWEWKPVDYNVNEAMCALTTGYIPGYKDTGSVYIVNNMQNNVFCGITDSPKLDSIFYYRNSEGKFVKESFSVLPKVGTDWNIYATDISIEDAIKKLSPYIDKDVSENFVYTTLFEKDVYGDINDQLRATLEKVPTIDEFIKDIDEATRNYLLGGRKLSPLDEAIQELEEIGREIYNG